MERLPQGVGRSPIAVGRNARCREPGAARRARLHASDKARTLLGRHGAEPPAAAERRAADERVAKHEKRLRELKLQRQEKDALTIQQGALVLVQGDRSASDGWVWCCTEGSEVKAFSGCKHKIGKGSCFQEFPWWCLLTFGRLAKA